MKEEGGRGNKIIPQVFTVTFLAHNLSLSPSLSPSQPPPPHTHTHTHTPPRTHLHKANQADLSRKCFGSQKYLSAIAQLTVVAISVELTGGRVLCH